MEEPNEAFKFDIMKQLEKLNEAYIKIFIDKPPSAVHNLENKQDLEDKSDKIFPESCEWTTHG